MGRFDGDVLDRSFEFALRILELGEALHSSGRCPRRLVDQLVGCGTAVGANLEEGQGAGTKKAFLYKVNIAWQEARECHFWLRLISKRGYVEPGRVEPLLDECEQLKKILWAIQKSTKAAQANARRLSTAKVGQ